MSSCSSVKMVRWRLVLRCTGPGFSSSPLWGSPGLRGSASLAVVQPYFSSPPWLNSAWSRSPQWGQQQQHRQAQWRTSVWTTTGLSSNPVDLRPPLLLGYLLNMFSIVKGSFCLGLLIGPSIFNSEHQQRRPSQLLTDLAQLLVCLRATSCPALIARW